MAGTKKVKNLPFDRTPDGTIELRLTIPWDKVKVAWEVVVEEMVKSANLPGFRKGKAPKKLVEERLDKAKIREEVVRNLLPPTYASAVKEHNLRPIIDPRIHIEGELLEEKDWEFHALTCEAPTIDLAGYKEEVKKITAKSKIVVPGKEPASPPASPNQGESQGGQETPKFDEIAKTLLETAKVTIPQILIEREADRLLSQMLDEIKRLGMTLDQYLTSTKRTAEDLRAEYSQKAQNDLKLEFVLQKVAESEKITVDDSDIEKAIAGAKPEEKQNLQANKYLLASIIRQQKTLDFLKSL